MERLVLIAMIASGFVSAASQTGSGTTEPQLRNALCAIRLHKYAEAQGTLENLLRQEPGDIYAKRLLPGVIAEQIVKDSRSPANLAVIRKAIEAFIRFSDDPQFSADERETAASFLPRLYELISETERTTQLLRLAESTINSAATRSGYYTSLASDSFRCANDILSTGRVPSAANLIKAKECTAKGQEFIDRAVSLDKQSESAYSYRASLMIAASKIAGLEKDLARKEALDNEARRAVEEFRTVSAKRNAERDARDKQEANSRNSEEIPDEIAVDLVEYKAFNPIDKLISEFYVPMIFFVEPVAPLEMPDIDAPKAPKAATVSTQPRAAWKAFSPDGDLSLFLPADASVDAPNRFVAKSGGIEFVLIHNQRPKMPFGPNGDTVLNVLAWSTVTPLRNFALMFNFEGTFEARLLNKVNIGGRPGRTYSIRTVSCAKSTEGTVVVFFGPRSDYSLVIIGAGPSDPRADRVIRSLKFK